MAKDKLELLQVAQAGYNHVIMNNIVRDIDTSFDLNFNNGLAYAYNCTAINYITNGFKLPSNVSLVNYLKNCYAGGTGV